MRVLVTGGLGYVGSVVALRLAQAGHEVALLTRGGRPTPRPPAAVTLHGDLLDRDRVRELVAGRRLPVDRRAAADEPQALALDSGRVRRALGRRPARPSLQGMVADAWAWLRAADAATGYRCAIGTGSTGSARSKPNTRL